MERRVFVLLAIMIGLVGCQSRSTHPSPQTPSPVSAPVQVVESEPEPVQAPPPIPPLASITESPLVTKVCDFKAPAAERLHALKTAVLEFAKGEIASLNNVKKEVIPCIRVERSQGGDILVVTGPTGTGGGTLVIAWKHQDQWHVAGSALETLLDWAWVAHGGLTNSRPDLVLVNGNYSGHAKRLLHVGITDTGDLQVSSGPGFGKSRVTPIDGNLILVTARTSEWYDLFPNSCEACSPLDLQVLTHWDGTKFVVDATRSVPNPVITLNRLRVALQRADRETAATLVATPALLDQIGPFLKPPADEYVNYADSKEIYGIEEGNWEALPAELRTPLPESLKRFTVTRNLTGGRATIDLSRQEQGWVVTGLETTVGCQD